MNNFIQNQAFSPEGKAKISTAPEEYTWPRLNIKYGFNWSGIPQGRQTFI